MAGVFLAKSMGAQTIAFGTHVTPDLETMRPSRAWISCCEASPK